MTNNREKWTQSVRERTAKNKADLTERFKKMPILQIALERLSLSRSIYYHWRDTDPGFKKNADLAIAEGEAFITDMSESQLISLIKDKHFPALQLWLRHHHPKYKERVEITGILVHERREKTTEEKELIKDAMRLAKPKNDAPAESNGTQ